MTTDPNDDIDFNVMHEPPRFVTLVRTTADGIVVVTDGADFPGSLVQWPDAMVEERAEDFWALGLLHLAEVEIVNLPPEAPAEAVRMITKLAPHDRRHRPTGHGRAPRHRINGVHARPKRHGGPPQAAHRPGHGPPTPERTT